jgi:hypothetical protein
MKKITLCRSLSNMRNENKNLKLHTYFISLYVN